MCDTSDYQCMSGKCVACSELKLFHVNFESKVARRLMPYFFEDLKRTVAFVSNYADDHGLVMPGRVPRFKRDDIKSMPS